MNREEWLSKAVDLLRPYYKQRGYEIPELLTVSCGFPSSKKAQGQCWDGAAVVNGVKQIYISPLVSDSVKVLDILSHELVHASLPDDIKAHGKEFKKACKELGLEGPAKSALAGAELTKFLEELLNEDAPIFIECEAGTFLPPYPHSKIVFVEKEKPQGTRMHKLICRKNEDHPETDIILRASKKVTALGIPMCFCGKEFEIEEEKEKD